MGARNTQRTDRLPRISIVTLAFNMEPFIRQTVESVLGQGYPDLEYIVVEPGSRDGTRALLEPWRDRFARFLTEPDRGPADGLNNGFREATGEVFGYLNGDDLFLPGALQRVGAFFRDHPGVDVVTGHGLLIDGDGVPLRRLYSYPFSPLRDAYGVGFVVQQSTFFRADAFRATGGFNIANRTCWDGELLLELGLRGCRIAVCDEFWSQFRIYAQSISGSGRTQHLYHQDRDRLFRRARGRAPTALDRLATRGWQATERLRRPLRTLAKLHDRLWGPPAGFLRSVGVG